MSHYPNVARQEQLQLAHDLGQQGKHQEAEALYRDFLSSDPGHPQVNFNMGVLIQQRANTPADRYEAASFYEKTILSGDADMELRASGLNNLGILMMKVEEPEKAAAAFKYALTMDPLHVEARINYAESLRFNNEFSEASKEFDTVLAMQPGSPSARFNRGMLGIMFGDLKQGFEDYEYRFDVPAFPTPRFVSDKPLWRGEDLNEKIILLTEEQGFGDSIQFIRFAGELKRLWPACKVWFYGSALLMELFKGVTALDRVFPKADVEDFDFHCPLLSLPHRLGTTLATIPAEVPYIWPVPNWQQFTLPLSVASFHKRKIGLVWAGSPRHGKDKWRSLEPEQFQPLIDSATDCQFYSLQVGPRWEEVERLKNIVSLAPDLLGWEYTAQAIQQLDLVLTVDTAVAHLTGALGKPVWMLCPHSPDFRWMLKREDSPWYPTMRIFRQSSRDDWRTPLVGIQKALCSTV